MCIAVVRGKGGDLIRFLNGTTEIPKTKWPSLLGIGSLCNVVVNGKGCDLIRFLNDARIPKDKRSSLLGKNSSRCAEVQRR